MNTFTYDGKPVRDYVIRAATDYHIVNGASSSFDKTGQVIVGLYGYKDTHPISGIYINRRDVNGKQKTTYHNFADLPKFHNYMGGRAKRKLHAKASKIKFEGKEAIFKLTTMPHKLIETDDQFVFTGEFFRSHQGALDRNNVIYTGLPNANLNDMYGHYGYLTLPGDVPLPPIIHHAYAVGVHKDGSLAWDDYQKLDIRNRTIGKGEGSYMNLELSAGRTLGFLRAIGNFHWQANKGTYAWYRNKKLNVKALRPDGREDAQSLPLKLMAEGEKIVHEKNASYGTLNWYDEHILIYGIQHIRPVDRSLPVRRVFFVNKVSLTDHHSADKLD